MTCPSRGSEFIPKAFDCITAALRSPDEPRKGRNFEIGRILHLKSEIRNLKIGLSNLRSRDFGFEMQDSSNFKMAPRRQEDPYEVYRACSVHPACREYCICGRCIGRLGVHSKNPERFELRARDVEGRR